MANLFVGGSAFVYLYWGLSGQLAVNVLGMQVSGAVTFNQALAENLGTAIKAAFTANLATHYATSSNLARIGVRDYGSANRPEFRDTGAPAPGIGTGDPLPPGTAMCCTTRTALSGKSFRGRIYLGGWAESTNDTSGNQTSVSATAGLAFLGAVKTACAGQGLNLAVVSRPSDEVQLVRRRTPVGGETTEEILSTTKAKPGGVTPVTAIESRSVWWETQRRRQNGLGTPISFVLGGQKVNV